MIGVYSSGIWKIPHLSQLLGKPCRKLSVSGAIPGDISAVAVWGMKDNTTLPAAKARAADLPLLRLEDGFIRSLGLGVNGHPPLSIVVDDLGINYDASRPSRLEQLIHKECEENAFAEEAQSAIDLIVSGDLSKYNHALPFPAAAHEKPIVLVIDQTYGDVSITLGGGSTQSFSNMLAAACEENPDAEIWVKTHPDVLSGKKRGYLTDRFSDPRIRLLAQDVSPQSLLRSASRVYTVTSQYGIEALMAGKPVTCFGLPWYAGWGLTDDRHPLAESLTGRRGQATLLQLMGAALLRYPRYLDPYTHKRGTLFDVLHALQLQRQHMISRSGHLWVPGLTLWKSAIMKTFLKTPENTLSFEKKSPAATACVVWGVNGEAKFSQAARAQNLPIWRMEDGFLRSSGLGSDLHMPLSLVLDKTGIYYDARRASDLETLLNHSTLRLDERDRALALQRTLVSSKLSKYNLGKGWQRPEAADGKRLLLVPGQVENDASIATGSVDIQSNLALLRTVRERNPSAFIVYKPHPDVLVGNRPGHIDADVMAHLADCVAMDADIIDCITACDELHTMTSLSGFEALMHGKTVYCYGLPFYAGWGLTHDEHTCSRRNRTLTLADLIYQTLIVYPTYIHPQEKRVLPVEEAAAWLMEQTRPETIARKKAGRITRWVRKGVNLYRVKFN
ncbi:capsular polysaccharide biosynthesis protein [Escherichia coli]|nr:capsular polysaccharide biosynthesis protein [Escherichia coli]EFH4002183.1 capsular polysaccharide biosynthesis protein [Escherichia coli]EFH4953944.1 capsular polysaccharide biosynthesis protein [Escherichia coli]EFH4972626.1 capsular polysaccharide biosynthesis protein [Escherichia coli]EFL9436483.1 capsular polysaccharide biosynthesis protein [Escherichia coli]